MGNETAFGLSKTMAIGLPDDICIVASSTEIERLREAAGSRQLAQFRCVSLPPQDRVPAEVIAEASVLVMQVDPDDPESLRRIGQVRSARPSLPLIVALHDAGVTAVRTLVRQGVNDVCTLPFDYDDLVNQLCDLSARMRNEAVSQTPLAPLVAVVRSTGGSGATTVATHLASALSHLKNTKAGACLVDLDIQFGNVAASLGALATTSVMGLLEAGARLDAEFLSSATVDTGRGFDLIAAPDSIAPLESVDVDHLLHLLRIARQEYDSVIIDLPANWTNWTLSAALSATDIVLVTELTISGLRQAKRRLELFDTVGIPRERVRVVVNRVERRLFPMIGVDEVERALGHTVYATLHAEPNVLSSSQDQGLLAWEAHRKSKFAADIEALASNLIEDWGADT